MTLNLNQLRPDQKQSFNHGVELFNQGEFWESHEAWEDVWRELTGDRKTLVQGLIQAAASFVHLNKGNTSSCRTMALKAIDKLRPYYPNESIDLEKLILQLESLSQFGCLSDGESPCQLKGLDSQTESF